MKLTGIEISLEWGNSGEYDHEGYFDTIDDAIRYLKKFENTSVYNFDNAFRGMRNALESWKKSDSDWNTVDHCIVPDHPDGCATCPAFHGFGYPCFQIGENDMGLAQRLIKAGDPSHRKFLRQIFVSVDITAPLYW